MRYGNADVRVFACIQGSKHASETVVLLHDPISSSFAFRATVPRLAAAGLRVITFDWPGCGLSSVPLDTRPSAVNDAKFLTAFFRAMGVRAAHLVLQVNSWLHGVDKKVEGAQRRRRRRQRMGRGSKEE